MEKGLDAAALGRATTIPPPSECEGVHVLEGEKSEKAGSWLSGGGERGEGLGVVVPAERCSRRTPA